MDTIHSDVTTELNTDTAALAFLERWKDPKEVSKDDKEAKVKKDETILDEPDTETEEAQDTEAPEDPPEDTETEETETPKKVAKAADDEDEISYTVDGVEKKASVKELKRLAGQEAALTRKSQDVAAKTKEADDLRVHHITALNVLVQKAEDAYRPYAELDMLVASREMSPEDFAAVRAEANATYAQYKFLTEELGGMVQQQAGVQTQAHQQAAAECIKELSDPVTGIPGYDQKMYTEMCDYAVKGGMKPEVVYKITDSQALKMIHKAMAYDNIKTVATTKKATSVKTVLKSNSNTTVSKPQPASQKAAFNKLKATGSASDAAELLMERWKTAD